MWAAKFENQWPTNFQWFRSLHLCCHQLHSVPEHDSCVYPTGVISWTMTVSWMRKSPNWLQTQFCVLQSLALAFCFLNWPHSEGLWLSCCQQPWASSLLALWATPQSSCCQSVMVPALPKIVLLVLLRIGSRK